MEASGSSKVLNELYSNNKASHRAEEENNVESISSSSDDEEDGDEQWKAAIHAAASSFLGLSQPIKPPPTPSSNDPNHLHVQPIKHYQIKAQKTLDDLLEKSLIMVKDSSPIDSIDDHSVPNEGGVRLFKHAPIGIVFDHKEQYKGPKKKPRLLPGEEINEKSKQFKRRLQSVVIEGEDIIATARDASQKALSRLEAKEAAARDAAKREEERVAELKKIRGEKWLPSIAREMQARSQAR